MGEVRPEVTQWLTTGGGIAADLRRVFTRTGMSQAEFARLLGWSPSKVSRYLSGKTAPSPDDIRWWCVKAGAPGDADVIVSKLAEANLRQFPWRQRIAGGYSSIQQQYTALHQRCQLVQSFEVSLVPGSLQTLAYAEQVLEAVAKFYGADSVEAKAAAAHRVERSELVDADGHDYRFVVWESALWGGPVTTDVLRRQLAAIVEAINQGVHVGVVPLRPATPVVPTNSFTIYTPVDQDPFVLVETFHGEAEYTTADDVEVYQHAFQVLDGLAVHGPEAVFLIDSARVSLGGTL